MQTVSVPGDFNVGSEQWWFIYNETTKRVIVTPRTSSGKISSPHTLVVADTQEECENYIVNNNLVTN